MRFWTQTLMPFSHKERGNAPIIAVLMITMAIGGYVLYQQQTTRGMFQTAFEQEAYNSGVDVNKNAIAITKALLEFPDGCLFQEPYYPVHTASIDWNKWTQSKCAASNTGKWSFDHGSQTITFTDMKVFNNKVDGELLPVKVTFQTPEKGKNWIQGENGPLLLSIDVEVESHPVVKQSGDIKGNANLAGQKQKQLTVNHRATIAMQRPPLCDCYHTTTGATYPFPSLTGVAPFSFISPGMFVPYNLLTVFGAPAVETMYCSGVVSKGFVTASIGGTKQIPAGPSDVPTPAKSVFTTGVNIGNVSFPSIFMVDFTSRCHAAYGNGDPVPEGTLSMTPQHKFSLHASKPTTTVSPSPRVTPKTTVSPEPRPTPTTTVSPSPRPTPTTTVSPSPRPIPPTPTATVTPRPTPKPTTVTTSTRTSSTTTRAQGTVPNGPIGPFNMQKGTPAQNPGGESFVGETLILMADMTQKRIDKLEVGDSVWNVKTNSPSKVESVIRRSYVEEDLVRVNFIGGSTTVTRLHPFYTQRGPVLAIDLKNNDVLISQDGNELPMISSERLAANGRHVYDLILDFNLAMTNRIFGADGLKMPDLFLIETLHSKSGFGKILTPSISKALPEEYQTSFPK